MALPARAPLAVAGDPFRKNDLSRSVACDAIPGELLVRASARFFIVEIQFCAMLVWG